MTSSVDFDSPVRLRAVPADNQPAVTPALEELYRGFERQLLTRLDLGDLNHRYGSPYMVIHRSDLHGLFLRARDIRDYSFTDWLYSTALTPGEEPAPFTPIPLDPAEPLPTLVT